MQRSAAGYFGAMVAEYDSLIRRAVPRYEEMIERLVDYLPERAGRVVELGCGTGNLSVRLAERYPEAELVLVDAAPEMLAVTRGRLGGAEGVGRGGGGEAGAAGRWEARMAFVEARFETLALDEGAADLIVSSISLHHVADKAPVYRALARALRVGGVLCFADQLAGATRELHALNWRRWLEHCRAPGNCTEAEIESLLAHAAAHDHYAPLDEQLRLLSAAGLGHLDCVWRNWIWGIVIAQRTA